ncbi:MAG: hypothetical protein AAGJ29_05815 [Pseudomonadota bacterium]
MKLHIRTRETVWAGLGMALCVTGLFGIGFAMASAGPAHADEPAQRIELTDDQAAEREVRLDAFRTRLNLSNEQMETLTPIIEAQSARRTEIFATYGLPEKSFSDLSRREKRALRSDMQASQRAFQSAAAEILTPEQIDEFQVLQSEMRESLRAELQNRSRR